MGNDDRQPALQRAELFFSDREMGLGQAIATCQAS
jgi:hypothetical protein